jgi:hypothetical protein
MFRSQITRLTSYDYNCATSAVFAWDPIWTRDSAGPYDERLPRDRLWQLYREAKSGPLKDKLV